MFRSNQIGHQEIDPGNFEKSCSHQDFVESLLTLLSLAKIRMWFSLFQT